MTMDERIEAVAPLFYPLIRVVPEAMPSTWENATNDVKDICRHLARKFLAAAFPELSGDKPTHWLAPTLLRERVDTLLETFGADEASGYQSRDRQYAIDMLRPARDAYLGKGDGG